MYNNLSTGGGLTFLKKFSELGDAFDLKYFSFNKLKQNNPKQINQSTLLNLFNRESILVANSVITALMLVFLPFCKKKFYVTHGYANAYAHLSSTRKFLLKLVLYLGRNRLTFIACGLDEKYSILKLRSDINAIHLIHNTVNDMIQNKSCVAPENKNLLFIGRISYQKGIDLLLDALDKITQPISLTIAGPIQNKEKEYARVVKEKINVLNRKGHKILLLGPINLHQFNFDNYKCCILPSRYEGFAFLPLELSNLKVPYILSNCLGHNELLTSDLDVKYSFNIASKVAFKQLIEKVVRMEAPILAKDFEDIHTKRLAKYSDKEFVHKYRKLFLECI